MPISMKQMAAVDQLKAIINGETTTEELKRRSSELLARYGLEKGIGFFRSAESDRGGNFTALQKILLGKEDESQFRAKLYLFLHDLILEKPTHFSGAPSVFRHLAIHVFALGDSEVSKVPEYPVAVTVFDHIFENGPALLNRTSHRLAYAFATEKPHMPSFVQEVFEDFLEKREQIQNFEFRAAQFSLLTNFLLLNPTSALAQSVIREAELHELLYPQCDSSNSALNLLKAVIDTNDPSLFHSTAKSTAYCQVIRWLEKLIQNTPPSDAETSKALRGFIQVAKSGSPLLKRLIQLAKSTFSPTGQRSQSSLSFGSGAASEGVHSTESAPAVMSRD